mgnify:CR=1 FL=1
MTTRKDVINFFHTEFQSKKELPDGLENQFFLKAIAEFELELYPLKYDSANESFDSNLDLMEQSLLGKIMYKHYLSREKDRILKLSNIVGKDISLTATGLSKSYIIQAHEDVVSEIHILINKLKESSYY